VGIPEFQAIGTAVAQEVARVLAPRPPSIDEVLSRAQQLTERKVREAGYLER
jgi:sorbitol/mannitol transport system substrate-binding protein